MEDLEKEQREFFKRANFVFDDNFIDKEKCFKIAFMYYNNSNKVNNSLTKDLLIGVNTEKGLNELIDLCMIYKIHFLPTLCLIVNLFTIDYQAFMKKHIKNDAKLKERLGFTLLDDFCLIAINTIQHNIQKFLEEESKKEIQDKLVFEFISNGIKKEAMEETFKRVYKNLENNPLGEMPKIDLTKFLKKDKEEINLKAHQDSMIEIFSNPRMFSKLYVEKNPHFMNKLSNDNLKYCKETDSFYFEELEKSLIIGYTEQNLIINIDKKQAINRLKKIIESLEFLVTDESKETKKYAETIIKLINEEKYSNYLPFKRIGKALGMNKNEARNYAKRIIQSVNDSVFDKYYEN